MVLAPIQLLTTWSCEHPAALPLLQVLLLVLGYGLIGGTLLPAPWRRPLHWRVSGYLLAWGGNILLYALHNAILL